jgi:hypothetical protein
MRKNKIRQKRKNKIRQKCKNKVRQKCKNEIKQKRDKATRRLGKNAPEGQNAIRQKRANMIEQAVSKVVHLLICAESGKTERCGAAILQAIEEKYLANGV